MRLETASREPIKGTAQGRTLQVPANERKSAQDFYRRRIRAQKRYESDFNETDRARSVVVSEASRR